MLPEQLENETPLAYIARLKKEGILKDVPLIKVLRPGHLYQLENFEEKNGFQVLQFIEKEPKFGGSNEMITINDGTTNEAVLEMLIDRCQGLYAKFPSDETAVAILHMKEALAQFELRTFRRIARGVEGKPLA